MQRFFPLFLAALFLTGCKNVFVNHILGDPQDPLADKTIYTVSIDPLEHGALAARPSSGPAGTEVILMVSPEPGYRLQAGSLKYGGDGGGAAIDEETRTFRLPNYDVKVSAVFEPLPADNFSISVKIDALDHGAVIARPEFGVQGTPVYLAVIPDPGYRYKGGSLKYNDTPVDEFTRTFLLPNEHVLITAEFEPLPSGLYTIRIGVLQHGQIFAKPEFGPPGAEVYLHVIPDSGYVLKEKSLKYTSAAGETVIRSRGRTFTMPADHVTVAAEFVPVPGPDEYTAAAENTPNGRIIPEPGYGKEKAAIYLHVIPDPGYVLVPNSLKIKGPTVDRQVNEGSRIFEMPPEHVRVRGEFKALPPGQYTVRVDMTDHGRILAVPSFGAAGTVISLQVRSDFGYRLKTGSLRHVSPSGHSVSIDEVARTFSLPPDHVTVRAEFEELPKGNYMVFSGVTANGHISPAPESGPKDTEIFLWVTPDPGYQYKAGTLNFRIGKDGTPTSVPDETRTFRLPESHVLAAAEFEPVAAGKYTIRISPASHGRIFVKPEAAAAGEIITLTIKPDPKYGLKKGSLKYTGSDGVAAAITGETFTMPGKHITVQGEFESFEHQVWIDKNIRGGQISVRPEKAHPGETIFLSVKPANGNRYEAGSLKYLAGGRETAIDPKTLRFTMPNEDVTITAGFKAFTALQNLKINGRPLADLTGGKTDYTVWIPSGEEDAVLSFDIAAGAAAEPKSGTTHSLQFFENPPVRCTVKDPDGITETTYTFKMIRELVPTGNVPSGKFVLNKTSGLSMEITEPFRIGTYELTQEEWRRVMGYDRGGEGNDFPANGVKWYEAIIFCNKLSMMEKKIPVYSLNGRKDPDTWGTVPSTGSDPWWDIAVDWDANGYRLPTEMEWIWAAIGAANGQSGTNTNGAGAYAGYPAVRNMDDAVWYSKNSGNKCRQKGAKEANQLGLYDMSGNIAEWCWDWYDGGTGYEHIPGGKDYTGPDKGSLRLRVLRGGYYGSTAWTIFLSFRGDKQVNPNQPPYGAPKGAGMRLLCRD